MNILFTCAGRRNYLINYFKEALNGEGCIYAADMQASAPAMIAADRQILVPSIYSPKYIDTLSKVVKEHHIDLLISLNDLELPILAKAKTTLEQFGARVIVPDLGIVDIASDKKKTADFILEIGLKTPRTFLTLEDALNAKNLDFPLVVKPRWGSASIGIEYPESMDELKLVYKLAHMKLKKTILMEVSKQDLDKSILIQEKITGAEYGMDVLNDFKGNYMGTFVRKKLAMRAGETDKAVSVIDSRFEKMGRRIGERLKHIGNLDCDVLERDGELYLLEINARFGGGYPFSHEAGMNTAAAYIGWLKNETGINKYNHYKAGLTFSKYDCLMKI